MIRHRSSPICLLGCQIWGFPSAFVRWWLWWPNSKLLLLLCYPQAAWRKRRYRLILRIAVDVQWMDLRLGISVRSTWTSPRDSNPNVVREKPPTTRRTSRARHTSIEYWGEGRSCISPLHPFGSHLRRVRMTMLGPHCIRPLFWRGIVRSWEAAEMRFNVLTCGGAAQTAPPNPRTLQWSWYVQYYPDQRG